MKVIVAAGFANGLPCSFIGHYLMAADFDAYDGEGLVDWTDDLAKAMKFPDFKAALEFWRTPSKVRPRREDGRPNRPLTCTSVEIMDAENKPLWTSP